MENETKMLPFGKKKCSFCDEIIDAEAIKCRFCKENLSKEEKAPNTEPPPPKEVSEWYIMIGATRHGPLTISEIKELLDLAEIDVESTAWKKGMPDWQMLRQIPELGALVEGPPPPKGSAVNNFWLWAMALAPIWGTIIERIVVGFIKYNVAMKFLTKFSQDASNEFAVAVQTFTSIAGEQLTDTMKYVLAVMPDELYIEAINRFRPLMSEGLNTEIQLISWLGLGIFLLINSGCCIMDSWILKNSGWSERRVSAGWCFLVPVYMGLRSKVTKSGWACFIVWFIALFIVALLPTENFDRIFGVRLILETFL